MLVCICRQSLLHSLLCTLICAVLQIGTDSQVVKSIDIATMRKEDATFKVMQVAVIEVLCLGSSVVGLQRCTFTVLWNPLVWHDNVVQTSAVVL